jgi:hypothetical protein
MSNAVSSMNKTYAAAASLNLRRRTALQVFGLAL